MQKFRKTIRISVLYATALLLVAGYPLTTMAEGTTDATAQTTVSTDAPTTPKTNESTAENTTPLIAEPVSSATTDQTSEPATTPSSSGTESGGASSSSVTAETPAPTAIQASEASLASQPTVVTPDQTATAPLATNGTTIDAGTAATISNALDSAATSGDATAKYNTNVGDTTSGNASAAATIVNNVNSTLSNTNNQKAASFVTNVMGDVNGDIVLQPILLKAMLESGQAATDKTINVTNTSQINNDINLDATSGNAAAIGNTTAGNATTGTANTVANVMNIVNSMVAANQSFIGTVNIYGNLEGDILIAPDFIPQLLASNAASPALTQTPSSTTVVNASDTQSIVNNISLAASSGKADLLQNTTAGNATTGDAKTNIVIFNLSGHAIVASNSLLVFVNVLGQWVGVIVDAPTGATAAAIGNDVTANNTTAAPDLVISANDMATITNNITLRSTSGDATLARNTTAGNATSGDATASVNIANITGSQLGLSGWFGVLFINVFGTWHGSFGIDTPYGNPVSRVTSETVQRITKQPVRVIDFRPHSVLAKSLSPNQSRTMTIATATPSGYAMSDEPLQSTDTIEEPAVLAATAPAPTPVTDAPLDLRLLIVAGATFLTGLCVLGFKRLF